MVDTIAKEVRLSSDKTRTIIVLVVLVITLLWLYLRKPQEIDNINNTTNDLLSPLGVSPVYVNYDVPALDIPTVGNPGLWDWMQTTDCACNCDEPDWQAPMQAATSFYPVYAYIAAPAVPSQIINYDFPVYSPPPPPTWWYEWGYNVHHEQAEYVMTSTGVNGILGKYSRSGWPTNKSYPQQTKNVNLQGDDAYIDGVFYKHDPRKDQLRPPNYAIQYGAGG